MRLIPDAALAWRFASVQAALLLTILTAVQADVVPMLQPLMDNAAYLKVSAVLSLLVIVLRVVAQPGLEPERQRLQHQQEHTAGVRSSLQPGPAAVDEEIERLAATLYEASGLSKAWEHVSPESKAKWRHVAAAAIKARTPAADAAGEHF